MNKTSDQTVFVCDLGFSALKWKYGESKGRIVSAFTRQDRAIILGEDALLGTGSSYIKTPEELVRFYPPFVEQAASDAGIPAEADLVLAVGLPYGFWLNESAKDSSQEVSAIAQLKQTLSRGPFQIVFVFPQGLGGIISHLNGTNGNSGNVLGIDIGFNTVISTLYSRKSGRIIYGETYYKRGVHQMAVKLLLPKIANYIPGRSLTPVEISYLMEKGYIQYGLDQIDLKPEIEQASRVYMEDTLADIVGDLRAHLGGAGDFTEVVFFGGGARLFKGISSHKVQVTIIPDPEYANAGGFEQLALNRLAKGEKQP